MITAGMKIEFRTPEPLSQDAGMAFWSHGSHFMAMPGRCTYQFTTAPEAESLTDGITAAVALIESIVAGEGFRWDGVVIEKINASVAEAR